MLDENYGRKDAQCEQRVKDVFNASNIDIQGKFEAYEADSYKRIHELITVSYTHLTLPTNREV